MLKRDRFALGVSCSIVLTLIATSALFSQPVTTLARVLVISSIPTGRSVIARELGALKQDASELSGASTVVRYLSDQRSNDLLFALSADEAQRYHVGNIIFADPQGYTRAQTVLSLRKGDHVPRVTYWGTAVATQGSAAMTSSCPIAPLLLVAGEQVHDQRGQQLGQVYAIQYLDDTYARHLRDTYYPAGSEVAFVSDTNGLTGDSFSDTSDRAMLSVLADSHAEPNELSPLPPHVRVGSTYYFIRSTILSEGDHEIGHLVVFVPDLGDSVAIMLAGAIALVYFLIHMGIHQLRGDAPVKNDRHGIAVVLVSLTVFTLTFVILSWAFERSAMSVDRPRFEIYNSTMNFEPEFGTIPLGSETRIAIKIRTGGESINVANATITWDPSLASVSEVNMDRSFCDQQLMIQRDIDNNAGKVTITCGIPGGTNAGDVGSELEMAELAITPKRQGSFSMHFDDQTSVLASDGLGTNVLRETTDGFYDVYAPSAQASTTLEIASLSHPNSARWYSDRTIDTLFFPHGTPMRYIIATSSTAVVPTTAPTATDEAHITAPGDGVFYIIAESTDPSRPSRATYRVLIDSTPPATPTIHARTMTPRTNEPDQFDFASTDATSGLQPIFYLQLDGGIFWPVGTSFYIPFQHTGDHTIVVRAFDRAGNYSDASLTLSAQ